MTFKLAAGSVDQRRGFVSRGGAFMSVRPAVDVDEVDGLFGAEITDTNV